MQLLSTYLRSLQRRLCRLRFAVPVLLFVVLIAACSSSDKGALNPGNQSGDQTAPTTETAGAGVTTTSNAPTTTSTTEAPTTTVPPPLSIVQISPAGSDANFGGADGPVASIERAIERLAPGGTIQFAPGQYRPLIISGLDGTADSPIRLQGLPGTEFRADGYSADAGILIENSSYIEVVGMTVRQALWGIYVSNSTGILILDNDVADIGQEAIRIKDGSSSIVIDSNRIADTGRRTDQGVPNGEGIYIGTGTPGGVDLVSDVVISNNIISGITDEAIDIKTPATGISIVDNTITDIVTHTSGAIVVHLNNELESDPDISIERNIIRDVTRSSEFQDGNCIVAQVTVRIVNNVLHDCQHRGIYLRGSAGLATILHNTFINAGAIGGIVDEGLGIDMVSENNLGVGGATNIPVDPSAFLSLDLGDYRLDPSLVNQFQVPPLNQVLDDLLGQDRTADAEVTVGAIEE